MRFRATQRGKLPRIKEVEEFILLDPSDVQSRLNDLRHMEDGWMEDGSGKAPDEKALSRLAELFESFYWSDKILPYTYPTPSGDIEMEWSINDMDFILEISLSDFKGKLVSSENDGIEIELDLGSDSGWKELNRKLNAACER
jgi:hypothetical protein